MPGTFNRQEVVKKSLGREPTPQEQSSLDMIAPLSDCLEDMAEQIEESPSLLLRRKEPFAPESQYLQELAIKIDLKAAKGDLDAAELRQIVNPNDIAERIKSAVLPARTLLLLDWLRIVLALLPLVLTCGGIANVALAYGNVPASRQSLPFLALWQQGFDGNLWFPWLFRLSALALLDCALLFLLLVCALAVHFYTVSRVKWRSLLAEEVRQKVSRELSLLSVDLKRARPDQLPAANAGIEKVTRVLPQQREVESGVLQGVDGEESEQASAVTAVKLASAELAQSATPVELDTILVRTLKEELLPEVSALGKQVESFVEQHARLLIVDKEAVDEFKGLATELNYSTSKLKEGIDIVDPAMQRLTALAENVGAMIEKQHEFLERMTNERKAQEEMTRQVNEMTRDLREGLPDAIRKLKQIIEGLGGQMGEGSHTG